MDSPHRCQAATSRGTRCRNTATAYHPLGGGREALLCDHHQRQDREGRLKLAAHQADESGSAPADSGEGAPREPYSLRVHGAGMAPRIKDGQAVLVEPGRGFQPGDEVVVGLKDGTRMVRELAFQEEGRVGLDAIPYRQDRIEVEEAEVAYLHLVTGILYGRRAAPRQA